MTRTHPQPWLIAFTLALAAPTFAADVTITGDRKVGSPITLDIPGPQMSEAGEPNPFRDVRVEVLWSQVRPSAHEDTGVLTIDGEERLVGVPAGPPDVRVVITQAYFAADGEAGRSGAVGGAVWRAHFVPDRSGRWHFNVHLIKQEDAALSTDRTRPTEQIARGDVQIAPDADARGMLRDVGGRYPRFDNGEYWLKAGVDSPENFLAYAGFDGTYRAPGPKIKRLGKKLHEYGPHVKDWRAGDPTWGEDHNKGKGIIGAINYLADAGVNVVYMITMNVGGDGQDVWPWVSEKPEHRDRFDCSKLDQWGIVFDHMTRRGVGLHVLLQETENDQLLDNGNLGDKRKLYLRELVARYAHHPVVIWNLGEENTQTTQQQKAMADYIRELDPYDHPIVVHTYPNQHEKVYKPLLGHGSLSGPSVQTNADVSIIHGLTRDWLRRSAKAGRPWMVFIDEPGDAKVGAAEDGHDEANRRGMLRHALWGSLMAGGAGVEWYFGYSRPHNDLNLEDFRSRDALFRATAAAVKLFRDELPYREMASADEVVAGGGAWCLAKTGAVYAVYLPSGERTTLTLPAGAYTGRWYDAWAGRALGGESVELAGGKHELTTPDKPVDALLIVTRRPDK